MEKLLTVSEAAEILRHGKVSMYRLLKKGEIQSYRVGRKILVSKEAISNFLNLKAQKGCTQKNI